jgi:hypothetical protein
MQRLFFYVVVAAVLGALGLGVFQAIATNWDSITSLGKEEEDPYITRYWVQSEQRFWDEVNQSASKLSEQRRLYRDERKTPNWDTLIYESRNLQVKAGYCIDGEPPRSYSGYVKAKKQWCPELNKYAAMIEQAALAKSADWFNSVMPAFLGTMRTAPVLTPSGKPETDRDSNPACDKSVDAERWLDGQYDLAIDLVKAATTVISDTATVAGSGSTQKDWDQALLHVRDVQTILDRNTGKPPCQYVELDRQMKAWREEVRTATKGVEQAILAKSPNRVLTAWPALASAVYNAPDFLTSGVSPTR